MQHRQRDDLWLQHESWLVRGLAFLIVLTLILLSCAPASGGTTPPATTGVTVYVGAAPAGSAGIVYALRGDSGVPRWHSQTDASFLTLALESGVIYTAGSHFTSSTGSGSLSALRASDGSLLPVCCSRWWWDPSSVNHINTSSLASAVVPGAAAHRERHRP